MLEEKAIGSVRSLYLLDSVEMVDIENFHSLDVRARSKLRTVGNLLATEGLGLATLVLIAIFIQAPYESAVIKFEWCEAHLEKISYVSCKQFVNQICFLYIRWLINFNKL